MSAAGSTVIGMKHNRARLIAGLVSALLLSGFPLAAAEEDPYPGVALGAEVGPHQLVSSSTGNPLDGSAPITCSAGAGLSGVANATTKENYLVCVKTWRPSADVNADAIFQQAQRDATAAAEAESKAWAEAHPGQQKCIQWGPIVHANGVSTASGGVCANPVPVPSGSIVESATVSTPTPSPTVETSTPATNSVSESSTPIVTPAPAVTPASSPAPVNTNGFGGYAVVHPDGHVCGVIVSGSSDPFNNGGVMPQEYMGCPSGSRIVFQSAPSADGNVAGWHGQDVVLSGNTYTLPGGSTINSGIVTESNGRTWNSGTGAVINPGVTDTRTVLSDTATVLSETSTVLTQETSTVLAAPIAIMPLTTGAETATPLDDLDALPEVEAIEEVSNTVAAKIVSGKTRIEISTEWVETRLTVVATKKGSKKKYSYKVTTNKEGNYLFKSSVNLKGFTLVLYKGSEELDRDIV